MLTFIKTGFREIGQRKKLIFTWYAGNLLCALIIVAPLATAIAASLGTTLESPRLFENFDLSWLTEFAYAGHNEQFIVWAPLLGLISTAFLFMTTWLSGGLLTVLHDPAESFFAGSARWWWPFLRLFLFSLILYAIAIGIHSVFVKFLANLGDDSMSGKPSAYGGMANLVVTYALISFVNMLTDYAKIHMVSLNERKARRGFLRGIRFVFSNFRRTLGIYLLLTILMLLMLTVYDIGSEIIGQASIGAVLLLFLVRQILMVGRTWLRMVFLASERAFFVSRLPKPTPEPPPPTPTPQHILESLEFNESY